MLVSQRCFEQRCKSIKKGKKLSKSLFRERILDFNLLVSYFTFTRHAVHQAMDSAAQPSTHYVQNLGWTLTSTGC